MRRYLTRTKAQRHANPADPTATSRLLYVTWDGPGADHFVGLFAPILTRISDATGLEVTVVQVFRPGTPVDDNREQRIARDFDLDYVAITTAGTTLASTIGLFWRGRREIFRRLRDRRTRIVLFRSVVPAILLARIPAKPRRATYIYDSDGLAAELGRDLEGWPPHGARFRLTRLVEKSAVRRADDVLVRTDWAAGILSRRTGKDPSRFHVVANGRDPDLFSPGSSEERASVRATLRIPESALVLSYVGSFAARQRPALIAQLAKFHLTRDAGCHVLFITHQFAEARAALERAGVAADHDRIRIVTSDPRGVGSLLAAADIGVALQARTEGTRSVAIVKLGEYLLSGVPVVTQSNAATGFVGSTGGNCVLVLEGCEPDWSSIGDWMTDVSRNRHRYRQMSRRIGLDHFSLASAADDYIDAMGLAKLEDR